jgi:hypothetical protein
MKSFRNNALQYRLPGDAGRQFGPVSAGDTRQRSQQRTAGHAADDAGPARYRTNPRNGRPEFNTSLFAPETLGQSGNVARRFFYGPGIANFDMQIGKTVPIAESPGSSICTS